MVDMDSWCPFCGYSIEPGTQFCGSCGQQIAASDGVPRTQSSTVTTQSPGAPYPGYGAPAAPPVSAGPLSAPTPPPPFGSPTGWPPPPTGAPVMPAQPPALGQPGGIPDAPLPDIVEQMLRPQGLFQNRMPPPADWQQGYPPAPGQYPPGAQYPQGAPFPPGSPYPPAPGGQYLGPGPSQPSGPPQPWPQAPTGTMPAAGAPALPAAPVQPGNPPAGQYPQGGAYPDPYSNGQYPGAQYGQDQFPPGQFGPGQFGPGVQYGPDGTPADGGMAGKGLLAKLPFKRPLVPLAVVGGLVVVVVAALTLSSHGGSSSTGNGTAATSPTASSSTGTTALTQQQAATALAGLLAQSGTDHADVNAAVSNVEDCKGLPADAQTFNKAAANRQTLLSKLSQLPGRSALPAAMISNLTNGWQASATVDTDLGKWAAAEAGNCKKNDLKNPAYAASLPYDSKATNGKTDFVNQWNGLARKYGLSVYQPSQI